MKSIRCVRRMRRPVPQEEAGGAGTRKSIWSAVRAVFARRARERAGESIREEQSWDNEGGGNISVAASR